MLGCLHKNTTLDQVKMISFVFLPNLEQLFSTEPVESVIQASR